MRRKNSNRWKICRMGNDKTDALNQLCIGAQPLKNRQKVNYDHLEECVPFKGAQSRLNGLKSLAKLFNFVVCNPCQSSPSLTILVPLWFIIVSLMFFYLCKVLFSGFLQFNGNFVDAQNNSKYRDWAPLKRSAINLRGKTEYSGPSDRRVWKQRLALKTRQMFSVHTTPEEFKSATITGYFSFLWEKESVREITLPWQHRFRKASFSKCFPPH